MAIRFNQRRTSTIARPRLGFVTIVWMMRFSTLVDRISGEGSEAWHVHDLAVRRQALGEDVIVLSIGDPDFDTPAAIIDAAVASVRSSRTHYSPMRGEQPLLDAIAPHASRLAGRPIGEDRIVSFPGAQCGLFATAMCLLETGTEVIVPDPAYVTYEAVIGATGASMARVPLDPERGFHLEAAAVAAAVSERTRAVLINSPNNPTGAVLTRAEMEGLGEVCCEHDLWLICDEVYGGMTFGEEHVSPLALERCDDRVVSIGSLSKSHAMTGWRIGWVVAPPALTGYLSNLSQAMLYGSPQFIQDAAAVAIGEQHAETEQMREAYRARAQVVVDELAAAPGLRCRMPDAGMFIVVDIRETRLAGRAFALELLERELVAVLPCEAFGKGGAGHVRISLAESEDRLREACRRICRFADAL